MRNRLVSDILKRQPMYICEIDKSELFSHKWNNRWKIKWYITWSSVTMYYKAVFELDIPKITHFNLCKSINYSTFICPFEYGKCGKEGTKLQKFKYLKNEKTFLDEIKSIFHSIWRVVICEEIKSSGHKTNYITMFIDKWTCS